MFHVKRLQTEETAINLFIDISEVQQVAIAQAIANRTPAYCFRYHIYIYLNV
jgi:hypothetical protein